MKSESIAELAKALSAFQGELQAIYRDAENPFHKSHYATLSHILTEVRPLLKKHELAISQHYAPGPAGKPCLATLLMHASGEWIEGEVMLPAVEEMIDQDGRSRNRGAIALAQDVGAQTTYLRRFSLAAILGLEAEDDDGETAMGRGKRKSSSPAFSPRPEASAPGAPVCNGCGKFMTLRKAKNGSEFWGCTGYPECKYTRPAEKTPEPEPELAGGGLPLPDDDDPLTDQETAAAWITAVGFAHGVGYDDWRKLADDAFKRRIFNSAYQRPESVSCEEWTALGDALKAADKKGG